MANEEVEAKAKADAEKKRQVEDRKKRKAQADVDRQRKAEEREQRSQARRQLTERVAERLGDKSAAVPWLFPVLLFVVVVIAVWSVVVALDLKQAGLPGPVASAKLTWGMAAMFLMVAFTFAVVTCNVIMFRCGNPRHALLACVGTTLFGIVATIGCLFLFQYTYLGPSQMATYLETTALCVGHVRTLATIFDGLGLWSGVMVVATSAVILANKVTTQEELSRQLRGSRILMYCAAALLVTIVAEVGALHKWPAHAVAAGYTCITPADVIPQDKRQAIEAEATAISAAVGCIGSLVLAAAYLPLGILLRQRAYGVVKPWERTEAWLAIHGFALQPTQQLGKVLLILSPLMAGGPISYLITLLSSAP
jgi:hypothetical protein